MTHSTFAANSLLDHTFGVAAYTQPAAWWVQLHYGAPGDDGTANAWAAAGRASCGTWDVSTIGRTTNLEDLLWEDVPSAGANDDILYCTIWDDELAGNCLHVCLLNPQFVIYEEDYVLIEAGSTLTVQFVRNGQEDFRYVLEDFNDWTEVHDEDWITSELPSGHGDWYINPTPSSRGFLSLDIGGGRNGGNAVKVTSTGDAICGWWHGYYVNNNGSVANPSGDSRFRIPRGLRCNYFDITMRFTQGLYNSICANPNYFQIFHWGTYCVNPESTQWQESGGYHFYQYIKARLDLANGGWITFRFKHPDYMRSYVNTDDSHSDNPTHPEGDFLTILSQFYFSSAHLTPPDPEIDAPYDYWIDEIACGWEEPRQGIDILIEDWVDGQRLSLTVGQPYTYNVTVTNSGTEIAEGNLIISQLYLIPGGSRWRLLHPNLTPITNPVSLAPGETLPLLIATPSYYSDGANDTGIVFVRTEDLKKGNWHDANHEHNIGTVVGCPDAHRSSFHFKGYNAADYPAIKSTIESGLIINCPANGSVSRLIKARYPNNSIPQISIISQPAVGGTVSVDASNIVTFTATPGYTGVTSFRYTCTDMQSKATTTALSWVNVL